MAKKLVLITIVIIFLFLLYNFAQEISNSLKANYRLDSETEKLTSLQEKNKQLKKKLEEVKSLGYIETQARDKLNLVREGETVFIIPEEELNKVLGLDKKLEDIRLSNWEGWLRLFFK